MEWMIQYRIKGDTTLHKEIVDVKYDIKWDVIRWWKSTKNTKNDKQIVNCSNNGNLNIPNKYLIGVDLAIQPKESDYPEDSIIFAVKGDVLMMEPGKFSYNGVAMKDTKEVYESFVAFLQGIEKNKNTNEQESE